MGELIKEYFRNNGLVFSIYAILAVILLNTILIFYYRNEIVKNSAMNDQVRQANHRIEYMNKYVNLADLGLRGYMIGQDEKFLTPYNEAMISYKNNLEELREILTDQGFNITQMNPAENAIHRYMNLVQHMVQLCVAGNISEAEDLLKKDQGYEARREYSKFEEDVLSFETGLAEKANAKKTVNSMVVKVLIGQIFLLIAGIPILIMTANSLKRNKKARSELFRDLSKSNREYIFDPGTEVEIEDEGQIISELISNLKKSTEFINNITNGQYDIRWEGLTKENEQANARNIAGELMMMRDQMRKAKKEDEIRIWTNEGLSNFSDLIRKNQDDLDKLSDELISNIVQYLGAQQGGLFFVDEDDNNNQYLKLMGCYAYERKKFLEKRIEIGQGLVGQCFLEAETTHITNIPEEYVSITSGLGDTNPTTLLIVPLLINEEVVGVIEIASLKPFEKHQIEFLERLAETIASSISSVKTNESTRLLLEKSQQQTEEMRAQEEEMRQNMEELQATQEQMHRKNKEVENLLKQTSENEEHMKSQMEELSEIQKELSQSNELIKKEADDYKNMLTDILNEIPQKVFLKDAEGKMYLANQKVADAHGLPLKELIGKSDYDFVDKKTADVWRKQELEIMTKGEDKYVFEDTIGGKKTILESIKKVFDIKPLNQKGLLGIQSDITEKVALENELKALKRNN
ncbi:MAG: GAF domain-containing protein [Cytophagales bacterium]|nr:GAF domain-containing protein [Cytophagales bacterium]